MPVGTGKAMKAVVGQCLRKKLGQLKKPIAEAGSSLKAFLLPEIVQEHFSFQGESSLPFPCLFHSNEAEKGLCCLCVPSQELR